MDQNQLRDWEEKCIQECLPPCSAACPLHVDVRTMMADAAAGNFSAALALFKRTVPFPGIIARICDQPCRTVCNRRQAGGAIRIADIELACLAFGKDGSTKIPILPSRNKTVSIIGAGLSGLSAAFELRKKGYRVFLYDRSSICGGRLHGFESEQLPESVITQDLSVLEAMGVDFRLETPVFSFEALQKIMEISDAVYWAVGAMHPTRQVFSTCGGDDLYIDPFTCATARPGLFAGGSLLRETSPYSPVLSLSDGRRSAVSIDRYLQQVSLSAGRSAEGSFNSCLYTDISDAATVPPVPAESGGNSYTPPEATSEAGRCLQCQCLECVKVCPYLAHYKQYPRKYVRQIYNNLSIVMGARKANQLINSCSLCGLCGEVCPNGLDMAQICRQARQEMVSGEKMPLSAHEFPIRDMLFSNSPDCELSRHAPGAARSDFLFFPGCQLSASAPAHVEKAYKLMMQTVSERMPGASVGLMLRCCGAPADWAGNMELFDKTRQGFEQCYRELGSPVMVVACSSCYSLFKTCCPQATVKSLWEFLDELLPAEFLPGGGYDGVVSIHDSCRTRHESRIQESIRNIVSGFGYRIEELSLSRQNTACCSYGGLMWFANRVIAEAVIRKRVSENQHLYVTYCSMCRDFFASAGKRTLHLLDLYFEQDLESRALRKSPGWSMRHENRRKLKQNLLERIWKEKGHEQNMETELSLSIDPEVQAILDNRLILTEDVRRVIAASEASGRKFVNPQTARFLACYRPARVTYWVEYSKQGNGFAVHNAYCHRMEIAEERIGE